MKFICPKSELLNGLQVVSKAVPAKTTMTILECILVDCTQGCIKLTANDMELGIETIVEGTIEEPGVIALDAKIFLEIVRKLPDNDITILSDNSYQTLITCEKAKFNISEIIVTIMLNYIAINFLGYAVRSFLMDPEGNVPQSAKIDKAVQLGTLIRATRFHAGILIAIICVLVVWFFLEKTTMGYELKAVGLNKRGSTCNGISVMKNIVLSAFLSGGLSAVAGGIEVLAIQKKLLEGISSNCGYTAVLIALVAFNNPIGVFFVAVLYAAMQVGASSMQRQLGVPSAIVNILIGLVVVLILGRELFHFKKKQAKVGKGGNA